MVTSVGPSSYAPQIPWPQLPSFDQLDANGDGEITLDELETAGKNLPAGNSNVAQLRADAFFKKLDTDGNGSISKDELAAFQSSITDQMQSMLLQLQEQGLSQTQAPPITQDIFSKIDANGDGSISQNELQSFLASNGSNPSTSTVAQVFDAMDINKDGTVDPTEMAKFAAKAGRHHHIGHGGDHSDVTASNDTSFDPLDTNHDGVVSPDELAAAADTRPNDSFAQFVTSLYKSASSLAGIAALAA